MEFLHIYLLAATVICSLAAAAITAVIGKETVLNAETPTFIQEYLERLEHNLERSRTRITVQQYFTLKIGCPAAFAVLSYFLSDDRSLMIIFIAMGFLIPDTVITLKKASENKKFEDRYIRALAQMAASLHSGLTVEKAVDSVIGCELLHDTVRDDFRILASKLKLGMPLSSAFYDFAKMTESKDAFDVATAITIMNELGGDAGEAIEKLQKNIENRLLYRKKRESMMTESKLIAFFADIMPMVILAGTYLLMPDTIMAYFKSKAMTAAFIGIMAILLVGSIIVHKMLGSKMDAS